MVKALLWLWQLPQHIIAFILWAVFRPTGNIIHAGYLKGRRLFRVKPGIGVCFGNYIFVGYDSDSSWDHEYGHSIQSLYFGPLYLLVIGIYSAVFCNLRDRLFHKNWAHEQRSRWYYSRWTEAWADRLGGVKRDEAAKN